MDVILAMLVGFICIKLGTLTFKEEKYVQGHKTQRRKFKNRAC